MSTDEGRRVQSEAAPGVTWAVAQDIARRLREFGYENTTAEDVATELTMPDDRRSVIGGMAVGLLDDYR